MPIEKMTMSATIRHVPRMNVPTLVVNQLPTSVSVSLPVKMPIVRKNGARP